MSPELRIKIWNQIYDLIKDLSLPERVAAVQLYIQQGGPIPNELGEKFRALLR